MISLTPQVNAILRRLNENGYEAYAVGGCVRDSLRGEQPDDWDICTSARPEQTINCFADQQTVLTGARYGTITVIFEGMPYEITTFRSENGYSDSRHPDEITFLSSLQEDLARRDFTVNAMAAGADGKVIDCFNGIDDLQHGIIRCVGKPEERFTEDALRILRALRFASRLGFSVASETEAAIHTLRGELQAVAPERLRKELKGLLCGKAVTDILERYADVLCVLIPEIAPCVGFCQYNYHHLYDVWQHTAIAVGKVEPTEPLRLAMLLHDIGKPSVFTMDKQLIGHFYGHAVVSASLSEQILRRLRFDKQTTELVTRLVREHDFSLPEGSERRMRKLLSRFGKETVQMLLQIRRADASATGTADDAQVDAAFHSGNQLLQELQTACFSLTQLSINGEDLMRLGVAQGPQIGGILQELLNLVIDGSLENDYSLLLQSAKGIIDKMDRIM